MTHAAQDGSPTRSRTQVARDPEIRTGNVAGRVRAALLLVVAAFLLLEGSRYLATALWRHQFVVLPSVGVRPSGEAVRWDLRTVAEGTAEQHFEVAVRDADGRPTAWTRKAPPEFSDCLATAWIGQPQMEESPLYRSGSYGPPWLPLSRWAALRQRDPEPWARSTLPIPYSLHAAFGNSQGGWRWSLESGRILRRGPDGQVAGGLGPDGWRAGEDGAGGARFERPWTVGTYSSRDPDRKATDFSVVIADSALRALFFVRTTVADDDPAGRVLPGAVSVARVPLAGDGEIRPLQAYVASQGSISVAVGAESVTFAADGTELARVRRDGDEAPLATFGGAWPVLHRRVDGKPPAVVASLPAPVAVIGAHLRFRVFDRGAAPVVTDVVLEPVTGAEHAVAWLRRSVAILRPPVLSLASFAAPAPATYEEMFSAWLLDPLYAGRREAGTLALCVALGAACAVLARRRAQILRPGARDVALWTAAGAVLGPLGLAWMRLVVPKQAVRSCACGRRRGVGVESCPACSAAWPAPARTGAEVVCGV